MVIPSAGRTSSHSASARPPLQPWSVLPLGRGTGLVDNALDRAGRRRDGAAWNNHPPYGPQCLQRGHPRLIETDRAVNKKLTGRSSPNLYMLRGSGLQARLPVTSQSPGDNSFKSCGCTRSFQTDTTLTPHQTPISGGYTPSPRTGCRRFMPGGR